MVGFVRRSLWSCIDVLARERRRGDGRRCCRKDQHGTGEQVGSRRDRRSRRVSVRVLVSILVAALTAVTWALAMTALPNKVPYPFTGPEIAAQWPGDYLWMYPAMLLMLLFVAQVAAIHSWAPSSKRVFSLVGCASPFSPPPSCSSTTTYRQP